MTTSSVDRRARMRVVEGVILVVVLISLGAGLSMLLGPNGLRLLNFEPQWPVVGASQYEMSVETQFAEGAGVLVRGAPTWRDTETGTVDARTGGRPVEVTGPFFGQVGFPAPSLAQRLLWVSWRASAPLLAAGALWLVLLIVRSVREGDPFTEANARRFRLLAGVVAVGGTLISVLGAVLRRWLLDSSGASNIVARDWSISWVPVLAGLLIAVLAQVWGHGVAMRDELEDVV
ncbi:DUF2975 domain-containing protein [Nocardioides mesophilus]|uniref:DUF2975 domain-containing protein n=1 Tax=Nocardioides mesophilus TaxID=433659 RepID=A0A7G9RG77_9ACTN|nr:DUF2975 domain-containing protein [Nocardioides mesophilus]QNN54602.1 DUF2975 domain-containing protein [Nocardioides mesophilus]